MEYEGPQQVIIQKEIREKEKDIPQEIYQRPNTAEAVKKEKRQRVRSTKPKSKFTIKAKAQKTARRKSSAKLVKEEKSMPFVPRKVFRVLSILRHDRFLKVVRRFFKPTRKLPAWNFDTKSKKKNKKA